MMTVRRAYPARLGIDHKTFGEKDRRLEVLFYFFDVHQV